jgi:hypothetical protein
MRIYAKDSAAIHCDFSHTLMRNLTHQLVKVLIQRINV